MERKEGRFAGHVRAADEIETRWMLLQGYIVADADCAGEEGMAECGWPRRWRE